MKDFIIDGVLKEYIGNDSYVTIPNSVTCIGDDAFYGCTSLKHISIPDSVIKIGGYAFCRCTSLKQVTIPDSVTNIGDGAFEGCESLEKITIPDSVTEIGDCAFYNCTSLTEVTIPSSVTKIGDYAFYGCESLKQVTIPNSVTYIGDCTFSYCISLQQVTIPDSVTCIRNNVFEGCNLKTKTSCYKAFCLNKNNQLQCKDYIFDKNKEPDFVEDIKVCKSGYHYCTNLFEIFDYYAGELDVDIAIYEIEPVGETKIEKNSSKCCCQSFKFKKRLYKEDIIRILNGGE